MGSSFFLKRFFHYYILCSLIVYCNIIFVFAQTESVELLFKKGKQLHEESKKTPSLTDEAYTTLEEALKLKPDDPKIQAYFAGACFIKARNSWIFTTKLLYVKKGIEIIDRAAAVDSIDVDIRRIRGMSSFQIPESFKRIEIGISDMTYLINYSKNNPGAIKDSIILIAYANLIRGSIKLKNYNFAKTICKEFIERFPAVKETDYAKKELEKLNSK